MLAPFILLFLEALNLLKNIKPGAYLIGWDNLFPEFNLSLSWQRSFFSLWQEYRGLGILDGMAHSANLLHTLYISVLSILLPQHLLRFVFIHLTHLVGGIGLYYLALHLTKNKKASIFAAIFYMFNLGIIQMYFAPLEVFATHFAALPWMSLVIINALKSANRRNLIVLFITSLLFSPQGFVPTVFIAFLILFFFLLLFNILRTKNYKRALLVGLCVFLGNAFWITPYVYSGLKTPEIIQNTRINQYGSEEIYYRNKAHGTLIDTLELKGFMLTTVEYDQENNTNIFFMNEWRTLSNQWWYHIVFAPILGVSAFGTWIIIRKKKNAFYPFIATYGVLFLFLANNTFLLEQLNTIFRSIFPLLGEAFRFPFTKFITAFAFCLSILLSLGLTQLFERYKKISAMLFILLGLGLGAMNYPALTGNFTSPLLRLKVPQEYFGLISYMRTQDPDQRIAMLPTHTFWNWHYRTWGHRGSGFLWYGLEQPTLERAFDPWSLENEQEYNEMAFAINSQNRELLNNVLEKYDISYLLLDEYIVNTISTQPVNFNRLVKFLDENPNLTRDKTFDPLRQGVSEASRLLLYRTANHPKFVYQIDSPTKIDTSLLTRRDNSYIDNGIYSTNSSLPDRIYPFSSLFTEKLQKDIEFTVEEDSDNISLRLETGKSLTAQATISIPSLYNSDYLIPVRIDYKDKIITLTPLYPQISLNGNTLPLKAESFSLKTPVDVTDMELNDIGQKLSLNQSLVTYLLKDFPNTITLSSKTASLNTIIDTRTLSKADIIIPLKGQDSIDSISVSMPKSVGPFSVPNVIPEHKYEIQKNDPGLHPFSSKKSVSEALSVNDELALFAKSGSVQINFYKPNLPHQQSYLLLAEAEYKSGLPIRWYMDNTQEKRAEVEGLFARTNGVNTFILPASQDIFTGYGFHFTLKSVGTENAASTLKRITLYPFPQSLLEKVVLTNNAPLKKVSERTNISYEKIHPGLFRAQIKPLSTLVLSQKYDAGWKAYTFTTKPDTFSTFFPFLKGYRLTDHMTLNNWSNAWNLDGSTDEHAVVIYEPLYLQYLGLFITFVLSPILILASLLRKNRRST